MEKFFKVRIDYSKKTDNPEEEVKIVREEYLFESVNYIDAESSALSHVKANIAAGSLETNIQKVNYDEIFPLKDNEEDTFWYESKITIISKDEKGNEKFANKKILVESEDLESSIEKIHKNFDSLEEEWFIASIVETTIDEVVFLKID